MSHEMFFGEEVDKVWEARRAENAAPGRRVTQSQYAVSAQTKRDAYPGLQI